MLKLLDMKESSQDGVEVLVLEEKLFGALERPALYLNGPSATDKRDRTLPRLADHHFLTRDSLEFYHKPTHVSYFEDRSHITILTR